MSARYAVFFSPADGSPLAAYGQQVLGRSAAGAMVPRSVEDLPECVPVDELSAAAAHYGFHATLKAPFQLASASSEADLFGAVEQLASRQQRINLQGLRPRRLQNFMALCLDVQPPELETLASQCVIELDELRAPLTDDDLRKRQPHTLNPTQLQYLNQFGYPFVMTEFRFHMTLSGVLKFPEHAEHELWLTDLYRRYVVEPPVLDRLCIFWQADRTRPFSRIAQYPFP